MYITRPQWPHTVDDIRKSLDGVWGLVGATDTSGNLVRLERSLQEPWTYTLIEYKGQDETQVVSKQTYSSEQKDKAVGLFASKLGFSNN